jgi:DNA-binding transcriptional LysR family regulator
MNEIPQTKNPLDSRQLNAFVTFIRTGSFGETVHHLCLTQSSISHSLRALESEIRCRFLARMGKTVTPTEAVEALLHHARLGLNGLSAVREKLEKLKTLGTRHLRVGASSPINSRSLLAPDHFYSPYLPHDITCQPVFAVCAGDSQFVFFEGKALGSW